MATEGIEALTPGNAAPPFSTELVDGSELSIPGDLAGEQVLLFFYPADNTPNSTGDLKQLGKFQAELADAGIKAYGISGGTLGEHRAFADRYGITLPLLADPQLSIARRYGCAPEDAEFVQRTLVGIDADGKIAFFERGFPLYGKAQPILDWFAGKAGPAEVTGEEEAEEAAEGGKLADLDEEQRRAIYIEIKQARDRAWAEAEQHYPLDAEGTEQREQVRRQGELAFELEEQYLTELAVDYELIREELMEIEAEGDSAEWAGTEIKDSSV